VPQFCHRFNSYASPTPVIEEGRLYVSFGSPGIACINTASGKVLWQRRDLVCNHYRGAGSSPIVHGSQLIHPFDGSDRQYLAALDKGTGDTVWVTGLQIDPLTFVTWTPTGSRRWKATSGRHLPHRTLPTSGVTTCC
jgi:outer membrane protein assembly factor BamB